MRPVKVERDLWKDRAFTHGEIITAHDYTDLEPFDMIVEGHYIQSIQYRHFGDSMTYLVVGRCAPVEIGMDVIGRPVQSEKWIEVAEMAIPDDHWPIEVVRGAWPPEPPTWSAND